MRAAVDNFLRPVIFNFMVYAFPPRLYPPASISHLVAVGRG